MTVAALRPRVAFAAPEALLLGALAMAMAMCTAWATIAAGWNEGMSLALATTAIAVVEAVLLASSTAGRLTATIAAPLLGLLVIVPTTIGGLPAVKGDAPGGLRHVVTEYGSAFTTGLLGESSWAFIVGFCGGMWLCAFFAAWAAVRERRGLFAALPLYGILASNAINAPRLGAVALPSLLAMGFSLILLTRTTLAFLEQRWRGERVVALPGTHRRFGRTALIAAASITLFAAVLPPLTNTDISGRLFHFNVGSGKGSGDGSGSGGAGASQDGTIHFSPDTVPGGALTANPQPVLTYTLDGSDSVYLRVINDTVFEKGNWHPSEAQRTTKRVPLGAGQIPRDRSPAAGAVTTVVKQDIAHIRLAATVTSFRDLAQVPFPGEPNSVDRSVTAHGDATPAGDLLTVDHVDLPRGIGADATLNVIGDKPAATEDQLRKASTTYPQWINADGYLALDVTSASDRSQLADITKLAQDWTRGLTTVYDQARAVEAHLRSAPFVYTLTPPPAPPNEWPIHAFLINNNHGYCQYFASSMGTMLRALHIPTRLVTGYGPGSVDDTTTTSKSLRKVSTSDAHVWVEAYFPQYGWVPFEPTPSSADGDYQPIPRPVPAGTAASPTPEPSAAATTPAATPTPDPQAGAAPINSFTPSGPSALLLAIVGSAVTIALVVSLLLSWLLRPRTLRALWKRMGIVGALLGTRRRVNETLGAYCERLASVLPPDRADGSHRDWRMSRTRAAEDLRVIGELSGKAAFSRQGLAPAEVTHWRRAWRGLVRLVPRMLWRRLGRARPGAPAESLPLPSTQNRG